MIKLLIMKIFIGWKSQCLSLWLSVCNVNVGKNWQPWLFLLTQSVLVVYLSCF